MTTPPSDRFHRLFDDALLLADHVLADYPHVNGYTARRLARLVLELNEEYCTPEVKP